MSTDTTELSKPAPARRPGEELSFSDDERKKIQTLIVESEEVDGQELRDTMKVLGFVPPHVESDHVRALKIFQERPFTHVLFTAKFTNMEAVSFLESIKNADKDIIAIPTSYDPKLDDVFTLLQKGARWFLVKPFTKHALDDAILQATKGEPFSESLLFAEDRNAAFSALIAANIDSAAAAFRDARKYATAKEEQAGVMQRLKATAQLAKIFAEGSEDGKKELGTSIIDYFFGLARGPASKLGRLRRQLRKKRGHEQSNE